MINTKLIKTTYKSTNHEIIVWEVVTAADSQPDANINKNQKHIQPKYFTLIVFLLLFF